MSEIPATHCARTSRHAIGLPARNGTSTRRCHGLLLRDRDRRRPRDCGAAVLRYCGTWATGDAYRLNIYIRPPTGMMRRTMPTPAARNSPTSDTSIPSVRFMIITPLLPGSRWGWHMGHPRVRVGQAAAMVASVVDTMSASASLAATSLGAGRAARPWAGRKGRSAGFTPWRPWL